MLVHTAIAKFIPNLQGVDIAMATLARSWAPLSSLECPSCIEEVCEGVKICGEKGDIM